MLEKTKIKQIIKKLVKLQSFDEELRFLEEDIALIPEEINQQNIVLKDLQTKVEEIKEQTKKIQIEIKEKEIEIQTIEQQVKKHTQELNSVKTNEQYKALLTEISKLNEQKDKLETDVLSLMDELEKENKEILCKEQELKKNKETITKKISDLEQKQKLLQEKLQIKQKERDDFVSSIDKEYLDIYNHISSRKETALSSVNLSENTCNSCNMSLTKQEINEIVKYESFVFCSSCSRILYLAEDLEEIQDTEEDIALSV
ncbi:MAG: hypothetical protein N2643_01045 [Endomicrobia bacterium]|nr:hypothetical protein [Endomicrobiia bacterium]